MPAFSALRERRAVPGMSGALKAPPASTTRRATRGAAGARGSVIRTASEARRPATTGGRYPARSDHLPRRG